MTLHTGFCISLINSNQLQSLAAYSDMLHIGLHRLCDITLPLVSMPPHVPPLCLFVCLFAFVPWHHMLLALFVYFPFWIVSVVDRQQANVKSNCTCCIRRGLGRRLRSSLLLNSSPRCDPPCRIPYLHFNDNSSPSTSRDASLSRLAEIHLSPAISMHSDSSHT